MAAASRSAAAAIGAVFVAAFQLQLLPFFSHLFIDDRLFWPIIYYGFWGLSIGLALAFLASQRSIFRRSLPVLAVCGFAIGVTFTHPLDNISKNFIVGAIFVACATVLAIASAPIALLRFSASATALSAVICLLDVLFSHGFTNAAGRAAGLSINANVAAAGLFLGAASSFWAVPHRLRSYFILIVGAAMFVTLSRSTLLAATIACSGIAADALWTRLRSPGPHRRIRWLGPCALALALSGWIVGALFSNDQFPGAAMNSFQQIGAAPTAFGAARDAIASAIRSRVSPLSETSPESKVLRSNDKAEAKSQPDEIIKEIARRVQTEGDVNSISARGLLLESAFLSYRTGPFFGQGLSAAHALQPHNTFLLFAVAFGDLGWIVPIAFLGLTACWVRSVQQLPLFLATLAIMTTSHDILLTPGLLAPIIFGIAGLNASRYSADDASWTLPAIRYTAIAAPILFALGAAFTIEVGLSEVRAPAGLLLLLVFGSIVLWSIAVWLWSEKLMRQDQGALLQGQPWD